MTNAKVQRLSLSCRHDSKMKDGWGDELSPNRRLGVLMAPQSKTEVVVCLFLLV